MIPSICYLKALISLQNEINCGNQFKESINIEISEANNNLKSEQAKLLVSNLENLKLRYTD